MDITKLFLISEKSYKPGTNAIGDIAAILPGNHMPSADEQEQYDIVDIPNITDVEFRNALKLPIMQTITDSAGSEHTVWRNSPDDPWMGLSVPVKYLWTTAGVTQEEQDILLSLDIPKETKLAMLASFGNNLSYQPENRTTKVNITISEEPA